ncbi:DUF2624 family protein [Tuberibacillus sp. Marseille-P3662]|uniref:DUF2624 family protein n=1 Tax=Tuberibacillus sp. Marseille-P3662 TaxID=1965358 RepID=UPI000A1CCCEE|nr:DUF2624 family protein [Tuberibacillus sp. Marseille-P3662]
MNSMFRQMLNQKINQLTPSGLVKLAKQYGFKIKQDEAEKVLGILQQQDVDIFNKSQRQTALKQLAATHPDLARDIKGLLDRLL